MQLLNSPTNTAPYFLQGTPADRTITLSSSLTVTNAAADWDLPAQGLTYSLNNSLADTNVAINGQGVITWTPNSSEAGKTNVITTTVTDTGVPAKSVVNTFAVIVLPAPSITSVTVSSGQVGLQWSGTTNQQFRIRWATNLNPPVIWNTFAGTNTSTNGVFQFVDTNAPLLMKFYQLLLLP